MASLCSLVFIVSQISLNTMASLRSSLVCVVSQISLVTIASLCILFKVVSKISSYYVG